MGDAAEPYSKHVEKLFQSGEPVSAIAEELNIPPRRVRRILCTEERLKRLYYDENLSQREIGEKFGVTQPAIARRMKMKEVETDSPPKWTEEEDRVVENWYREYSREKLEASLPNRSWNSIKCRATKLGVARSIEELRHSEEVKKRLYENSQENMIKIDFDNTSTLSYILGVVDGDGFHNKKSTIGLEATSKKFVEKFAAAMETVGMNPGRGKRRGNRETVWGSSKQLVEWIMDMGHEKKFDWLTGEGRGWKYIEGRYESDGNVTNHGTARICSYDERAKQFISKLLTHLGIDCSIQQNNVYVFKTHAEKFFKNINPVIRERTP